MLIFSLSLPKFYYYIDEEVKSMALNNLKMKFFLKQRIKVINKARFLP